MRKRRCMPKAANRHSRWWGPPAIKKTVERDQPMTVPPEYHEPVEAVWIVYDLSDPSQWNMAGLCIRCWGRERAVVHSLDAERVVVEFKPGGAVDLREST